MNKKAPSDPLAAIKAYQAVGEDGWPIAARSDQRSSAEVRADVLARRLRRCELAWKDGQDGPVLALAEAVRVCHRDGAALPAWAVGGVLMVLNLVFTGSLRRRGKKGRFATPKVAHQEWMKHYTRWADVTDLREQQPKLAAEAAEWEIANPEPEEWDAERNKKDDKRFRHWINLIRQAKNLDGLCEVVAHKLRGTDAAGSWRTIKRSYQHVERRLKSGRIGPLFSPLS